MLRILSSKWTSFTRRESVSGSFDGPNDEQDEEESQESSNRDQGAISPSSPPSYLKPDGSIDYDALYDDTEELNISMESQGSVVTHLLSQVKIGMDLTKVALPTFILERRSLLEMYADYFAHPDMFVKIPDHSSERDRMVQVVQWYLCSYHAGRKSTVAKKPYNPILGEIFQCHWDIPGLEPSPVQSIVTDGPVPWCHSDQLTFVAEQVSHHPPIRAECDTTSVIYGESKAAIVQCFQRYANETTYITKVFYDSKSSPREIAGTGEGMFLLMFQALQKNIISITTVSAFYAEHYNKKISFTAYVWTKSKFLGLSIGVHNIGCGIINVMKYDEQYVVTFPNGYGRSILTVPWIELGGTVTINCEKTGYRASLEFLTKPFYGGKKHRINSEVFAPNEKKPFLTITGEWNGAMEAKWCDGRTEEFANVNNLTIIKKNVRPVEEQSENESRNLWKEVTAGLRLNNVAQASNAKCSLEQKQRFEAQQRKEMGTEWETKLFQRDGEDGWVYVDPLSNRLNYDEIF